MKLCPYCAEKIQDAAIKCRYCGEWLEEPPADRIVDTDNALSEVEQELLKRIAKIENEESPFLLRAIEKYFDDSTPLVDVSRLSDLEKATIRLQRMEPKALSAVLSIFNL